MLGRKKLAMLVAEFLGAGILTLTVLSVQRSQLGLAYFVAVAAGLAVLALTYVFGSVSGAHFNPALTLALWTARRVKTVAALLFIVSQVLGGWAAYGLYHYFVNTDVQQVQQAFSGRIMVAEAIAAMVFALAWSAAAYGKFNTSKFAAASGVGFIIAVIIASAASVGLVNPAIALGARAWDVFGSAGWLNYVLGPVLGAVIGVNLYGLLFADSENALLRRKTAAATSVSSVSSVDKEEARSEVEPVDVTADASEDNEVVDPDKAVNKNAKLGSVAPRSSVTVTKSKKSTAKKVASKKTTTRKKRA